jgi:hypothetical protein
MSDAASDRLWAIRYSNGWTYTDSLSSVEEARERGLEVIEYAAVGEAPDVGRRNADSVNDGTPEGRVYSALLHVQLDLQQADDEPCEEVLLDILDAWCMGRVLYAGGTAMRAPTRR